MKIAEIQQLKKFRDRILSGSLCPEYVHCDFSNPKQAYPHTFFELDFYQCREIFVTLYEIFLTGRCPEYFVFNFDKNRFDIEFAKILTAAFKRGKPPNFLSLNFKNCLMGDDCVIELSNMLRSPHTPSQMILNLENNGISEKGGVHLANTIRSGYCKEGFKLILNSNPFLNKNAIIDLLHATTHEGCPKNFQISIENSPLVFDIEETSIGKILNSGKCKEGLNIALSHLLITQNSIDSLAQEPSIARAVRFYKFPNNFKLSFYCSSLANPAEQAQQVQAYKLALSHAVRSLPENEKRGLEITCDGEKIQSNFESEKHADDYFTTQRTNLLFSAYNGYVANITQFAIERQKMTEKFQTERDALNLKIIKRSLEQAKTEPECPVCFEPYLKPGHTRKFLLPCRHMLCKACLQHIHIDAVKKNLDVKCPTCRWQVNAAE